MAMGVTASGRAFRRLAPRADNSTQDELANTWFILHLVFAGSVRLSSCHTIPNATSLCV
ncbi:protein of unknown function (plasmid) [Vibrio harveyi]|nr:protein of unknown function [Vibrio harveyi]